MGVAMVDAQGRRQEQAEARLGQGGESRGGNCPSTFGFIRGTSNDMMLMTRGDRVWRFRLYGALVPTSVVLCTLYL